MKLKLKTKSDYVKAHRRLWGDIVKLLRTKDLPSDITVERLKTKCICKLGFSNQQINNNCFCCEHFWNLSEGEPFLKVTEDGFDFICGYNCLNGLWIKINRVDLKSPEAVALAIKIRDFPVRK